MRRAAKDAAVVTRARGLVLAERQVQARWRERVAECERDLDEVRARVGEVELSDPGEAREVAQRVVEQAAAAARRVAELEAEVDIVSRAAAAQAPKVYAAERAYLVAEAVALDAEVGRRRAALAAHEKRTEELLAPLREHEGDFVSADRLRSARRELGFRDEGNSWTAPRSATLQLEVEEAERPLLVLREVIAGRDPGPLIAAWRVDPASVWPTCVYGPEALVPAAGYLAEVDRARDLVEELERLPEVLQAEVKDLHERVTRGTLSQEALEPAIGRREARIAEIPDELAAARARLSSLVEADAEAAVAS